MTLAEAVYMRSNSLGTEPQRYRPHRPPAPTSEGSSGEHSPVRVVAVEKGLSNHPRVQALRFGRFRLVLRSRELLADGVPLSVGNRALDILFALIEARGELVTKDELLTRVWPDTTVEENNLQFQVSTLRKILGEDRDLIRTVSGRGYRFVAEISAEYRPSHPVMEYTALDQQAGVIDQERDLSDRGNLAESTSNMVERKDHLKDVDVTSAANRLVTLIGSGAVGKTRLAINLARRTLPIFANDVSDAELGRVSEPALVTARAAPAAASGNAPSSLDRATASLSPEHLLLLLDSCEHILETVAGVAQAVLQASTQV